MADDAGIIRHQPLADGIHQDVPFGTYVLQDRESKSRIWTAETRSPAHALVDIEENPTMKLGTIIHCAVLEPDCLEERYQRGPEDRRGNKWKDFVAEYGDGAVTAGDYDTALEIRDAVHRDPVMRALTGAGCQREISCMWTDPDTGRACRARPDAFNPELGILCDLKSTADATRFDRIAADLGYHVGEAHYSNGWRCLGQPLQQFLFVVLETEPPYEFMIRELDPDMVAEGQAICRKQLRIFAECRRTGVWPGYPRDVLPVSLKPWNFRETQPQGEAA